MAVLTFPTNKNKCLKKNLPYFLMASPPLNGTAIKKITFLRLPI